MASPFSIFRKNQKLMLAVLTLLAMFGFVFIPIIMQGMRGTTRTNPLVVKTSKFGDLHESNIRTMLIEAQKVRTVLTELGRAALLSTGQNPGYAELEVEMRFGPATEEAAVNNWLMARYAQQLGMVVSDATINNFIEHWTGNRVKTEDIDTVLKRTPPVSATQFFDILRDELLAQQFKQMFLVSLKAMTPGQRWDYYNRVHCMASIEAIPLTAADYVKDVDNPPEDGIEEVL